MNNNEIDQKLDGIALLQAVWKNQKLLASCLLIAEKAVETPVFWPDSLTFDFLLTEEDRNLIGSAWRLCAKTLAIIEKTGDFRRSKGENTNGRIIFCYQLINRPIAEAFIKRYNPRKQFNLAHPQLELGL